MSSAPARWRGLATLLAVLAATIGGALAVVPAAAAEFYAGKSIDLLIGAPPAGGYDIYARAVGRHLGRHVPGQPTVVPKNMPGAGSARAAGYLSTVAPKDGTAIAAIMPGAVMGPLLDEKAEALFDPTKVLYLGTANSGTRVCVALKTAKIKSFDEALTRKAVFGGVSANDSTFEYGHLHRKTAAAQYDVVQGYRGTADLALAMERGEVDGVCGWDWSSFKSQKPDWLRDGKVNVILQVGLEPHPELTRMGVPTVFKYVKGEDERKVVELVISQQVFQRSYIAPPGIASAQLDTLRAAFEATMHDQQFLDDAEKLRIEISPLGGNKVQNLVQKLYATPKDVVERARQAIRP